jgi:hypothetical protein
LSFKSQRDAAAHLGISQPLLSKLLKSRPELEYSIIGNPNPARKRKRVGKDEEVEEALKRWFTRAVESSNVKITGRLLRRKAEDLARQMGKENFVATEGWLSRWKKRENIVYNKSSLHGEHGADEADDQPADQTVSWCNAELIESPTEASASSWLTQVWLPSISQYSPSDVYNATETGLYYRALPELDSFNSSSYEDRVTVLCCASMTGEKEELVVIGRSRASTCFANVKKLPVTYYSDQNAWMTSDIFDDWLLKWDHELRRSVLLLVSSCNAHHSSVSGNLEHIKVIHVPANANLIQPCDQGISRVLKQYYRHALRSRTTIPVTDAEGPTLLDAVHLVNEAWHSISGETIKNCWRESGFLSPDEDDLAKPSDLSVDEYAHWMKVDDDLPTSGLGQPAPEITDDEKNNDPVVEQPPTAQEMLTALNVLKKGVQYYSDSFTEHYKYESFIHKLIRKTTFETTLPL